MEAKRVVRSRHFNLTQIGRESFTGLLRRNGCTRHTLPDALEDAFSSHGYLEIYTDPLAKRTLEAQATRFISQRARSRDLVQILKEAFSGDFTVLAHGEDTICIIAGPENQIKILAGIDHLMRKPVVRLSQRDRDIAEVMASETCRGGARSKRTRPLAAIELDTSDSSREQIIVTRLLRGDIVTPDKPRGRR